MSTIVVMPGGFHPFHAGHAALYQSALKTFPGAEVFVAATNDTSSRPFPFAIKEKLAKLAGVKDGHFVQVKSPFQAKEITSQFNPEKDRLIFVRSEKDASKPPQAGGIKKDGNPAYLQPLAGQTNIRPFGEHAYMAYLPTVEFGPGMTSATEIRSAWPNLNDKRKQALVMSLYPATQSNPALAANVVKMLDTAMGGDQSPQQQGIAEGPELMTDVQFYRDLLAVVAGLGTGVAAAAFFKIKDIIKLYNANKILAALEGRGITNITPQEKQQLQQLIAEFKAAAAARDGATANKLATQIKAIATSNGVTENNGQMAGTPAVGGMYAAYQARENQPTNEDSDYIEEKWSEKYKDSINCNNPKGFSQRAHCQGRKK